MLLRLECLLRIVCIRRLLDLNALLQLLAEQLHLVHLLNRDFMAVQGVLDDLRRLLLASSQLLQLLRVLQLLVKHLLIYRGSLLRLVNQLVDRLLQKLDLLRKVSLIVHGRVSSQMEFIYLG